MTWKSFSKKKKFDKDEQATLRRLEIVRRMRQPFQRLKQRLIFDAIERYLPAEGLLIEIGMGDGQLREHLPPAVLPRLAHTEPLAAASREFRRKHPDVRVLQAGAENLPFANAEVAAVLGQCVLDVVNDGKQVARELARVLQPGGKLIHFLDMSTTLHAVFAELSGTDLIPLPNVFSDPSHSEWPDDVFLARRRELELVAGLLGGHGHAFAAPLRQYLDVFAREPLGKGVSEFIQLQESVELRASLQAMFRVAFESAPPEVRAQLADFQGRPVSSARHFERRLKTWFNSENGFILDFSGIVTAWEHAPRVDSQIAYVSSCVGEQRQLGDLPGRLLCADAEIAHDDRSELRELGIFLFVATRI